MTCSNFKSGSFFGCKIQLKRSFNPVSSPANCDHSSANLRSVVAVIRVAQYVPGSKLNASFFVLTELAKLFDSYILRRALFMPLHSMRDLLTSADSSS